RKHAGRRSVRTVLKKAAVCRHPLHELAFPRSIERALKPLEVPDDAVGARVAIGIAAAGRTVEADPGAEAVGRMRRTAEPSDIELRLPAAAVVEGVDVSRAACVTAVGVKQLRAGIAVAPASRDDPFRDRRRIER